MLTSSPVHTKTYLDSENLPPLRREWFANAGTILTVHTGSLSLCSRLAMLVAGMGCPSASAKILLDLCSVCMNGYPTLPVWDVHALSQTADGIDQSSNPLLTCRSASTVCLGRALLFLREWIQYLPAHLVLLRGCCRHAVLSLSVGCGGIVNLICRLPLLVPVGLNLACAEVGSGFWVMPTCSLYRL